MKERTDVLRELAELGRLRTFRPLADRAGARVMLDGQSLLNLSSNDYLGIGGDEEILARFYAEMNDTSRMESFAPGSTSSRLLSGDNIEVHRLEARLAECYGAEAALLFNSGYHINIGILPALFGRRDLILSDKLNHASIVDGTRLSQATLKRYRHLDYAQLRSLLEKHRGEAERAVIVSESVFSMDGDVADIAELVRLKKEFDCELYLDEAHAFGLFGKNGLGKAVECGLAGEIDFLVGVFGKALASMGSFVVCSRQLRDLLVNSARSLIFTTALPPVIIHWNLFAFELMMQMDEQRAHLQSLAAGLRADLCEQGLHTDGETGIVPVIIGEDAETVRLAELMREAGFLIFPVRPPTVPVGTSRFRLSLTAGMQWGDLEALPGLIAEEIRR
jgi:8-amino-7-oxononanoate synthase